MWDGELVLWRQRLDFEYLKKLVKFYNRFTTLLTVTSCGTDGAAMVELGESYILHDASDKGW